MRPAPSSMDLRSRMVRSHIQQAGVTDERILEAFMMVPREKFVPEGTSLLHAYGDHPFPIGYGQTVSQPFIVAFMIQLLDPMSGCRVLEIGTGSGYQTAILAAMGMKVVTVEVIPELACRAKKAVEETIPGNDVAFIVADGYHGWGPAAPYDGIIVSAAPAEIPEELEEQLSPEGGRLVLPAGRWSQRLVMVRRSGDHLDMTQSLPVRFVPLVEPGRS